MKRLPAISVLLALSLALTACQGATNQNAQPATGSGALGASLSANLTAMDAETALEKGEAAFQSSDYEMAAELFRSAAERGLAAAQVRLAHLYDTGKGVRKDLREAAKWTLRAAKQGNAEGQFLVGLRYEYGLGRPQDHREALHWYRLAAERCHSEAQAALGMYYREGLGVPRDEAKAERWFTLSGDQVAEGTDTLFTRFCIQVANAPEGPEAVLEQNRFAAEAGDPEAQTVLGALYQKGFRSMPKDNAKAEIWLRRAAEQGHPDGQYRLARLYYLRNLNDSSFKERTSYEYKEELKWFHMAAEQGHLKAMDELGNMHGMGLGVPKDKIEAQKWYSVSYRLGDRSVGYTEGRIADELTADQKAEADRRAEQWLADFRNGKRTASEGQVAARDATPRPATSAVSRTQSAEQDHAISLAENFVPGAPVASGASPSANAAFRRGSEALDRKDYAEALRWYQRGADQGSAKAQFALGTMYVNGTAGRKDDAEGARLIRAAAEQGLAGAQSGLGVMYRAGVGVPQDYTQAAKWLRLAAEQGEASAQSQLASMYGLGQGVRQDYAEAVRWFRSAADQDYADAQYGLGFLYQTGHGVSQDDVEAVRWFRKAADQGHAEAQDYLGAMYLKGWGVAQDLAAAAKWFRAAAEQGRSQAQHNLAGLYAGGHGVKLDVVEAYKWFSLALAQGQQESEEKLGLLSLYMNQSMIAEAERRADEWRRAYRARQRG